MLQSAGYSMINSSSRKIKVTFTFNGSTFTNDIETYRPIGYLKEKASKYFFPLDINEIRLIYNNKDLSSYENHILGDFFANKNLINIKIYQVKSLNRVDYLNENYTNLSNSPVKKLTNFQGLMILCDCKLDNISYYCRNCRLFVCRNCRLNGFHKNHLAAQWDISNAKNSLKFYCQTLQVELNQAIMNIKQEAENKEFKGKMLLETRKDRIINKLNEYYSKQIDILKSFNVEMNTTQSNHIENKANSIFDKITSLISNINNQFQNSMPLDKISGFFSFVSDMEDESNQIIEQVTNLKIKSEIENKFLQMYEVIENTVDNAYFSELNVLNLLDEKTLKIVEKVRNFKNFSPLNISVSKTSSEKIQSAIYLNSYLNESPIKKTNQVIKSTFVEFDKKKNLKEKAYEDNFLNLNEQVNKKQNEINVKYENKEKQDFENKKNKLLNDIYKIEHSLELNISMNQEKETKIDNDILKSKFEADGIKNFSTDKISPEVKEFLEMGVHENKGNIKPESEKFQNPTDNIWEQTENKKSEPFDFAISSEPILSQNEEKLVPEVEKIEDTVNQENHENQIEKNNDNLNIQ